MRIAKRCLTANLSSTTLMKESEESQRITLKVSILRTIVYKNNYFHIGKTPGSAGPIPKMDELIQRSKTMNNKWEFWTFPGIARGDGIEMRNMIQMIDETIRKKKAGTVTGFLGYFRHHKCKKESLFIE